MDWVIQRGVFPENEWRIEQALLGNHGVCWVDLSATGVAESHSCYRPQGYATPHKNAFFYGSTRSFYNVSRNTDWLLFNHIDDYKYTHYSSRIFNFLLNRDFFVVPAYMLNPRNGVVFSFARFLSHTISTGKIFTNDENHSRVFVRPNSGSKTFDAGTVFLYEYNTIKDDANFLQSIQEACFPHDLCIISSAKTIEQECRFWTYKDKLVTWSAYPDVERVIPQEAIDFAGKVAKAMSEDEYFDEMQVVDVCLHDGMWKVVELNCVNFAGMYKADVVKIAEAVDKVCEERQKDE